MDPSDGGSGDCGTLPSLNLGNSCPKGAKAGHPSEGNIGCANSWTYEINGTSKYGCRSEEIAQCLGDLQTNEKNMNCNGAPDFSSRNEEGDVSGDSSPTECSSGEFLENFDRGSRDGSIESFSKSADMRSETDRARDLDRASNVAAEEGKEVANGCHEALDLCSKVDYIREDEQLSALSCASLGSGLSMLKHWRSLDRCISATAKGFAIGAGLKGGLALFGILARLKRRSSSTRMAGIKTNSEAISAALKETIRYGLFLGTFAGTFASVDEAIAAFGGRTRTERWRALLAGGIAGPSMLLTGLNTQHTSLAIYILMRAAVLASRCGIKSEKFGSVCKPLTWSHGDIFLMCLSSSQILSAYILKQDSLPSSYKSFLNKHGGKDPVILKGVKELASCLPLRSLAGIEKYYKSNGVDIKLDPNLRIPCLIVHANQSCAAHAISFFVRAYARALPVYVPVYFIPALIVHRQGLLKEPRTILGKSLLGTARSSLFLSAYCSSAWMWTCVLFQAVRRCDIPLVAVATFPTGLALLIEKKSRRMEIALYCFARALESFFTSVADAGLLPHAKRMKRADVILFSLSTAVIMHCYAQERDVFRSKYLNVLDWVFGVPRTSEHFSKQDENGNFMLQ